MRRLGPPLMVVSLATSAAMCSTEHHSGTSSLAVYATTTTSSPPPTTTSTYLPAPPPPTTTTTDPAVFAAWSRVSVCEDGPGAWNPPEVRRTPTVSASRRRTGEAHNGGDDLSPANQIRVASEIEADAGLAGFVPDSHGCACMVDTGTMYGTIDPPAWLGFRCGS